MFDLEAFKARIGDAKEVLKSEFPNWEADVSHFNSIIDALVSVGANLHALNCSDDEVSRAAEIAGVSRHDVTEVVQCYVSLYAVMKELDRP